MADYHTYRVNVYEQAKILDRWVTPPRHAQVTSPTWDPLPPPEQALRVWCYWYTLQQDCKTIVQLVVNKNKKLRQNEILTAYAMCYNFAPVLNEKWGKQKKFSQIYLAGMIKIVLKL